MESSSALFRHSPSSQRTIIETGVQVNIVGARYNTRLKAYQSSVVKTNVSNLVHYQGLRIQKHLRRTPHCKLNRKAKGSKNSEHSDHS